MSKSWLETANSRKLSPVGSSHFIIRRKSAQRTGGGLISLLCRTSIKPSFRPHNQTVFWLYHRYCWRISVLVIDTFFYMMQPLNPDLKAGAFLSSTAQWRNTNLGLFGFTYMAPDVKNVYRYVFFRLTFLWPADATIWAAARAGKESHTLNKGFTLQSTRGLWTFRRLLNEEHELLITLSFKISHPLPAVSIHLLSLYINAYNYFKETELSFFHDSDALLCRWSDHMQQLSRQMQVYSSPVDLSQCLWQTGVDVTSTSVCSFQRWSRLHTEALPRL